MRARTLHHRRDLTDRDEGARLMAGIVETWRKQCWPQGDRHRPGCAHLGNDPVRQRCGTVNGWPVHRPDCAHLNPPASRPIGRPRKPRKVRSDSGQRRPKSPHYSPVSRGGGPDIISDDAEKGGVITHPEVLQTDTERESLSIEACLRGTSSNPATEPGIVTCECGRRHLNAAHW